MIVRAGWGPVAAVLLVVLSAWLLSALSPRPAGAEEVTREHHGIELLANLELAPGKTLSADGVVLLVHGTFAHHDVALMAGLQSELRARGVNTLSITLSLGLHRRRGPYHCKLEHDHRQNDASEEIAEWVDWLGERGASRIWLFGHSRGGAQVARFLAETRRPLVTGAILAAPSLRDPERIARRYLEWSGIDLAAIVTAARERVARGQGDVPFEVPLFLYCPQARVTADAFLDHYDLDPATSLAATLEASSHPILVAVAEHDLVIRALPKVLREAHLPSNVEVAILAEADHLFAGLHTAALAHRVAHFIERPMATAGR
jgi:pimeloyl-ACP methyl ester carboxylesterase